MKPTVAVVIGAGASIDAGAPSTADLTRVISAALPEFEYRLPWDTSPPALFRQPLLDGVKALVKSREMNFEDIAGAVEELLAIDSTVGAFSEAKAGCSALFDKYSLNQAKSTIIEETIKAFLSRLPPSTRGATKSIRTLLETLAADHRIVQLTLNYDSLLDFILPWVDGFRDEPGKTYKVFDPIRWRDAVLARDEHLLMHLHSSLRFGYQLNNLSAIVPFSEPVLYPTDELAAATTLNAVVSDPIADNQFFSAMPLIAGRDKISKIYINVRPFAYYSATALEELSHADTLIVAGYGFRDQHVNGLIDQFARLHPTGKIALLTYRSGADIGNNSAIENFILRIIGSEHDKDRIYVSSGGSAPTATWKDFGRVFLHASGIPLDEAAESGLITFIQKP